MKKVESIHFVGIKGVGMAPLAIIAKEAGILVSGSDLEEEFITDEPLHKKGIKPLPGFSASHIKNPDLVITTGANSGFENIEVVTARKKKIPILTQGQAVGEFMKGELLGRKFKGISVAGSHGKTTTAAMLATILREGNVDPSFLIGTGNIGNVFPPGHLGKGKYFIAEADEYVTEPKYDRTPKFLWQFPDLIIFTNIDFDHPDIYKSLDEIRDAFLKFSHNLGRDGILIANGDDEGLRPVIRQCQTKKITFGFSAANDYVISKVSLEGTKTFFQVSAYGMPIGEFSLNVIGDFNALNALGAVIAAIEIGLSLDKIKKGISQFWGSKRRLEFIGKLESGALVFDDYAHHPAEIRKTLRALRLSHPKEKIICVFQPHTYSRTKALFEDFVHSFSDADTVIFTDIYASLREKKDETVSAKLLSSKTSLVHKNSSFLPRLSDVVEYINQNQFPEDTIILTMGAGDVYKIAQNLKLKK